MARAPFYRPCQWLPDFHSRVSCLNDNLYDIPEIPPTTEQNRRLYYTLKVREMQFALGIFNISHIASKYTHTHFIFAFLIWELDLEHLMGRHGSADWPLDAAQLKHPLCTYFA